MLDSLWLSHSPFTYDYLDSGDKLPDFINGDLSLILPKPSSF